VTVIPNGVQLDRVVEGQPGDFRRRYDIPTNAPLVVCLGRVTPIKRLDIVAEAFRRVHQRCRDARLIVAGPDENGHRRQVEPLFEPLAEAVTWTGPVNQDQRLALLRDADVLVQSSDAESFGMSVVEAMAAARPVVVTKTCPWEEIRRHECGFWVNQTPEAIAGALLTVLEDRTRAQVMGQRGRKLVEEKYRWDAVAQRMHEEYLRVV
ncbi:MAG: glycosyltransferase family 4 protein, partial [Pseudomonadales bacterium]